jgi:hypothetical protein
MPLSVGESETIIDMVRTANKHLIVPDHKMLIDILSGKKIEASSKLKLFLKDLFFLSHLIIGPQLPMRIMEHSPFISLISLS